MKKTFVSTFAAALIAASASTTFAAANPFEDVPIDHWAYDAIAQLAAEGVIEGYGDGTYRGDQEITRYEMAQMVARAMAKGGGNKALLDKLAAEFADELNQLGVRVAALEKKVDNVTWKGTVRYRYITSRITEDNRVTRTTDQYLTLRLEPSMKINEHWTGHARIDYNSDMDSAANTTGNTVIGTNVAPGICVERVWVQGDYKNFQILLGKLPYLTNIDNGMIYDDNVAGGQLTFGNKVKATLTVGRSNSFAAAGADPNFPPVQEAGKPTPQGRTGSYQAIEIYNDRADKWTWGVAFHRWANKELIQWEAEASAINIWEGALGYKFNKNLSVNGAYAWTNSPRGEMAHPNATAPGGVEPEEPLAATAKRAWSIEFDYKGANPADKGSWGAFVAYRDLGSWAVITPTYDAMQAGWKGVELGVDYVFAKNIMGTVKYFFGKNVEDDIGDEAPQSSAYKLFTELNFFF